MIFSGVNTGLLPFPLMTHFLDMNTLYTEALVSMEMVCFLIQGLLDYLDKKGKILSMQTRAGVSLKNIYRIVASTNTSRLVTCLG